MDYLTDDEIIKIILKRKKQKLRRKRTIRRVSLLVFLVFVVILAIGIFINRGARTEARGIIFINAAHGGVDAGSITKERYEKNDTLRFSLKVRDELQKQGFKVYTSRTKDKDVDIAARGKMANKKKAELMISIHRNKAVEGSGVEVYISSSNDKASRLLGKNIFNAMIKQGFERREIKAGTLLSSDEDYLENSVPNMPSCLVELGFIQNKKDNQLFDDKIDENAKAFADAIVLTYAKLYEPEDIE